MWNKWKTKRVFALVVALIMIMQIISPVIAGNVEHIESILPYAYDEGESKDTSNILVDNNEIKSLESKEKIDISNISEGTVNVDKDASTTEKTPTSDIKINDLNSNELLINKTDEDSRDLKKLDSNEFKYDVKLYSIFKDTNNEKNEIGKDEILDISSIESLEYKLEFSAENEFVFLENDFLKLDITNLINLGIDNLEKIKEEKELIFDISGKDTKVGSYKVIENDDKYYLYIEFNENINDLNKNSLNRIGYANLNIYFRDVKDEDKTLETIKIEGYTNKELTIRRRGEESPTITKEGVYVKENDLIIWTIDINENLANLKEVKILDELSEKLKLLSVEVVDLEVSNKLQEIGERRTIYNNEKKNTYETVKIDTNNMITIDIGNLGRKAKRYILTTKIIDKDRTFDICNKVDLKFKNANEIEDTISANSSVQGTRNIGIIKSIKKPYDFNSKTITWEIELSLDSLKTEDTRDTSFEVVDKLKLNEANINLELVENSIKLFHEDEDINGVYIDIPKYNSSTNQEMYYKIENNEIKFILPNKYRKSKIIYDTKVIRLEGINSEKSISIENDAKIKINDTEYKDSAKANIQYKSDGIKEGKITVEKGDTFVEWKITINKNNENWKNVKITDEIPDGFEFIEMKYNGQKIDLDNSINNSELTYEIGETNKEGILEIKTKLINNEIFGNTELNKITNKAKIEGEYNYEGNNENIIIGNNPETGSNQGESDKKFEFDVVGEISVKEFDNYISKVGEPVINQDANNDYEIEIKWKADYITYKQDIKELIIFDEISKDGMHTYNNDSFIIYINGKEYNLEQEKTLDNIINDQVKYNDDLEYSLNIEENKFELKLNLKNLSNENYNYLTLEYNTLANLSDLKDGEEGSSKYDGNFKNSLNNKIRIKNGDDCKEATYTVRYDAQLSNNGYKTGKHIGDREFEWTVYLNHKSKSIQDSSSNKKIQIEDTISSNQRYIVDSIVITKANLITEYKDGEIASNLSKIENSSESVNFSVDYYYNDNDMSSTNNPKMIITINEDLNSPFIVEYKTKGVGISKEEYNNNISFNGKEYNHSIIYEDYNKFIDKKLINDKVYNGDIIEWQLDINDSLSDISNIEIKDELSEGLILEKDSVTILKDNKDVTKDFTITYGDNLRELTIKKDKLIGKHTVKYRTLVNLNGDLKKISNSVQFEGYEIDKLNNKVDVDKEVRLSLEAGGSAELKPENVYNLKVKKVDSNGDLINSDDTKLQLIKRINFNNENVDVPISLDLKNGEYENKNFNKVEGYQYFIKEIQAPDGYIKSDELYEIDFTNSNNNEIVIDVINYKEDEVKDLKVVKKWVGGPKEKPDIFVQLFKNGEKYKEPVKLENDEYIFTNLVKKDSDKENEYTVIEEHVSRYNASYEQKDDGTIVITNTYNYIPNIDRPGDPEGRPVEPENPKDKPKDDKETTDPTEEPNEEVVITEPDKPVDKSEDMEIDKPKKPIDSKESVENSKNNIKELLPKTGIEGFNYLILIGFILILIGVVKLKREE